MILKIFILFYVIFMFKANSANNEAVNTIPNNKTVNTIPNNEAINSVIKNNNDYSEYRSLMFAEGNINDIFKILKKSIGNKELILQKLDNDSDDIILTEEENLDANNISIFLNSIMYISPKYWSVWVNGNKITNQNNKDGDIAIINISPLKAILSWTISNTTWNMINANKQIPNKNYKTENNSTILYFTLSPNQTYIPMLHKIIEGKIKKDIAEETALAEDSTKAINTKPAEPELKNQDNLFF